jgi:hypothetical protein
MRAVPTLLLLAASLGCAHNYPYDVSVRCNGALPAGSYLATNAGGDRIQGTYCDGLRCGPFQLHVRSDVLIAELPFEDGVLHGVARFWYQPQIAPTSPDQRKLDATFETGTRHGESRYWWPNGALSGVVVYELGRITTASGWSDAGAALSRAEAMRMATQRQAYDEDYLSVLLSVLSDASPTCP